MVNILSMNAGDGQSSYANNSTHQKSVMLKTQKILEETINDFGMTVGFSECFKLVDLGCSSGPNTLLVVTNIIDCVFKICQTKNLKTPEIQVFLNDLPDNDFNTIFKMVPPFYSKLENGEGNKSGKCFVSGVPGSFYTRLFPSKSIDFFHSSYSLHWLSQVPENLENNKGNICMSSASPPSVYEAYLNQYNKDFSLFLRLRSEEVIPNGRMILTFLGRSQLTDPANKGGYYGYELLAKSIHDMSVEGLLNLEDINSFNLPLYTPCPNEVKAIVQDEGSFTLDRLETYEVYFADLLDIKVESVSDMNKVGKIVAKTTRAVMEPLLANHFGTENPFMDKLFERHAMYLSRERIKCFFIVISLTRKNV